MNAISRNSLPNAFHTSLEVDSECEQTDFYFDDSDSGCETTDFYDELESSGCIEIDAMEPSEYHQNISTQIYPDITSPILSSKLMVPQVKSGRNKSLRTKSKIFKKRTGRKVSVRSSASTVVHREASLGSFSFFSSFE